jgi:hypothetical protein
MLELDKISSIGLNYLSKKMHLHSNYKYAIRRLPYVEVDELYRDSSRFVTSVISGALTVAILLYSSMSTSTSDKMDKEVGVHPSLSEEDANKSGCTICLSNKSALLTTIPDKSIFHIC